MVGRIGGVTGKGFTPGVSGNPGGRPKGLSRRVRELVGDDGHEIADFMFGVLSDEKERTADRMEAAKWLADRGFGKAPLDLEVEVAATEEAMLLLLRKYSLEDLETMRDIHSEVFIRREDAERFIGRGAAIIPTSRPSFGSRSASSRRAD